MNYSQIFEENRKQQRVMSFNKHIINEIINDNLQQNFQIADSGPINEILKFRKAKKIVITYDDSHELQMDLNQDSQLTKIFELDNTLDVNLGTLENNFLVTKSKIGFRDERIFSKDFFGFHLLSSKIGKLELNDHAVRISQLDPDHNMREEDMYTNNFEASSETIYEYDNFGRIISSKTYSKYPNSKNYNGGNSFNYDNGRIEETVFDSDGNSFKYYTNFFDDFLYEDGNEI